MTRTEGMMFELLMNVPPEELYRAAERCGLSEELDYLLMLLGSMKLGEVKLGEQLQEEFRRAS